MKQKTKINAEDGKQELVITREFDLPLELLFNAYVEPAYIYEANEVEKAGLKVNFRTTREFIIPEEFEKKLDETLP